MLVNVFLLLLTIWTVKCVDKPSKAPNIIIQEYHPIRYFNKDDCGSYGFRCLNEKEFQMCPFEYLEGRSEKPGVIHSCKTGFVCDEENPAFCTPSSNSVSSTTAKASMLKLAFEEDNLYYEDYDNPNPESYFESALIDLHEHDHHCECSTTTTTQPPPPSTETTTVEEVTKPIFECDNYGFYPDYENNTMFWYCDVPPKGNGFLPRHMKCGEGRHFIPNLGACILPGTISREERKSKFTCEGKTPGKYEDNECQVYHICFNPNYNPTREIRLTCPHNTAYDPKTKTCTKSALYRCIQSDTQSSARKSKVYCKMPSRFRDVKDCGGYFLCFGDEILEMRCPDMYKFDDNSVKCLPERIARCQELE